MAKKQTISINILIFFLIVLSVIFGFGFLQRNFGFGPQLYLPDNVMHFFGFKTLENVEESKNIQEIVPLEKVEVEIPPIADILVLPLSVPANFSLIASQDSIATFSALINDLHKLSLKEEYSNLLKPTSELSVDDWDATSSTKSTSLLTTSSQSATANLQNEDQLNQLNKSYKSDQKISMIKSAQINESEWRLFADQLELISKIQPMGVTLFGSKISFIEAKLLIQFLNKISTNSLIMVDHEGGSVQRLSGEGFDQLPSWNQLCKLPEEEMKTQLSNTASRLKEVGVNVVFAPVVDVGTHGFMGSRVCSSDPNLVAQKAADLTLIYNNHKIKTVIKHFPGIGGVKPDLHVAKSPLFQPSDDDIAPFLQYMNLFPKNAVMNSFVRMRGLDESLSCPLSQDCMKEARNLFPSALFVTDALEMKSAGFFNQENLRPTYILPDDFIDMTELSQDKVSSKSAELELNLIERSILAIEAGNDVILFGPKNNAEEMRILVEVLKTRYTNSNFFAGRIDQSRERIKSWKQIE